MQIKRLDVPNGVIVTASKLFLNIQNPKPEQICIEDIALGLSRECRFGNQTKHPYYVAQHSVLVSSLVRPEIKLRALLHDASEAYIKDIPSPLKHSMISYYEIEERLMNVIFQKFCPNNKAYNKEIKDADQMALEYEWEHIVNKPNYNNCWDSRHAYDKFMFTFKGLILEANTV
jgi:hypothetical protein